MSFRPSFQLSRRFSHQLRLLWRVSYLVLVNSPFVLSFFVSATSACFHSSFGFIRRLSFLVSATSPSFLPRFGYFDVRPSILCFGYLSASASRISSTSVFLLSSSRPPRRFSLAHLGYLGWRLHHCTSSSLTAAVTSRWFTVRRRAASSKVIIAFSLAFPCT